MAWIKIDDQFPNHPKIRSVGPLGLALQASAICYCGQYLTDGFLPTAAADQLIASLSVPFSVGAIRWTPGATSGRSGQDAGALPWAQIMVGARLWEPADGGFIVHDYLEYNPTRVEILEQRDKWREIRAAGGRARARSASRARGKFTAPHQQEDQQEDQQPAGAFAGPTAGSVHQLPASTSSPSPSPSEKIPPVSPPEAGQQPAGAFAGPRARRPAAKKNPDAQAVIDAWFQAFKAKFGSPPPVNGAKAYRLAQTLVRGRTPEEALWLVRDFMENPPDYYATKNMFGLEHVLRAAPELLARRGPEPEPPRAWMSHEPRGR